MNFLSKKVINFFVKKQETYHPIPKNQLDAFNQTRVGGAKSLVCYAPVKNLYFRHQGKVVACCYNREYVLGTYPEKSIHDIWFGNEAEKLRNHIKNNDLTLGCFGCENLLRAGNYDAVKAKMYDEYSENKKKYPSVMEFELSSKCNLECIMCNGEFSSSIRKNREKRPPLEDVYDDEFVKQLEDFIPYLDEVKFYGGEPFLIPVYYEIWDKIAAENPNCRISVQTNATTLNNRVKNCLERGNFHLNISLDSLDKENFERIRKNANFERVIENLHFFHAYAVSKSTFFGISTCVMKENWRELPAFIHFCNQLEVPIYFHTVYFPSQRALWNLDSHELNEIYDFLSQQSFPTDTEIQRKNKIHYENTLSLIEKWKIQAETLDQFLDRFVPNKESLDAIHVLYFLFQNIISAKTGKIDSQGELLLQFVFKRMNQLFNLLPDNFPIDTILTRIKEFGVNLCIDALHNQNEEILVNQLLSNRNEN